MKKVIDFKRVSSLLFYPLFVMLFIYSIYNEFRINDLEDGFEASMSQSTYIQEKYSEAVAFIRNSTKIIYVVDDTYYMSIQEKSLREYLDYYDIAYEEIDSVTIEHAFIRGR